MERPVGQEQLRSASLGRLCQDQPAKLRAGPGCQEHRSDREAGPLPFQLCLERVRVPGLRREIRSEMGFVLSSHESWTLKFTCDTL